MARKRLVVLGVVTAVVLVGCGAVWYTLIRDTADPEADVDAIASDAGDPGAGDGPATADGTWTIEADGTVFVGYRVQETFAGDVVEKTATGRTPAVEGTMTVDGDRIAEATFTADLLQLKSDQARRDSALLSRGLELETYPEASFELTSPIPLPSAPAEGETVEVTATGDLTLHGRTAPVELALEGRWEGATISVAGSAPITFADFGMEAIDMAGFVRTDDHGVLELQLLFVPA